MLDLTFVDVERFRVQVPKDMYPVHRSGRIAIRETCNVQSDLQEWLPIPQISDDHCDWPGTKVGRYFTGKFPERNPLNVPGPFYGAETDTCATGPIEAPKNVLLDAEGMEFVFRQPSTLDELTGVIYAAICDPFAGYGADGNDHWTTSMVREWWNMRDESGTRFLVPGRV